MGVTSDINYGLTKRSNSKFPAFFIYNPVGSRPHECNNKQTKKLILFLNFACNTDLGPKDWLRDQ